MSFFDEHYVNSFVTETDAVLTQFSRVGCVTVACEDREKFLAGVRGLGDLIPHRDSDTDGVTVVEHRDNISQHAGYLGMSSGALRPHTDSSGLQDAPRGLALLCEKASGTGGEAVLIDGFEVATQLKKHNPVVFDALSKKDSVIFASGDSQYRGAMFCDMESDNPKVRLRLDGLGYFNYDTAPHLLTLLSVISSCAVTIKLNEGTGYIIDNYRYFHGRRAFSGSRRMLRLLFSPSLG